jgi:hypothetical protein
VGASQRHAGKWDDNKYNMSVTTPAADVIGIYTPYARVEGIQVSDSDNTANGRKAIRTLFAANTASDVYISDCIIRGRLGTTTSNIAAIYESRGTKTSIWNNIIYGWKGGVGGDSAGIAIQVQRAITHVYAYNNTIYNCHWGFDAYDTAVVTAKNNIVQKVHDGFYTGTSGSYSSGSDYNLSDLSGDAPGSHSKNSVTVAFTDSTSTARDFHLQSTDAVARGAGTDLSSDANLSFTDDVDAKPRYGTWDIGADQYWDDPSLAVTMDAFYAQGGDQRDTIFWRTQSEDANYGFNIYRRIKAGADSTDYGNSVVSSQKSEAKTGRMPATASGSTIDELPSTDCPGFSSSASNVQRSTSKRLTDKFNNDTTWQKVNLGGVIPGSKGGRSVGPRLYKFVDIRVENGVTYEYTIEDIDYSNVTKRHGLASATPHKIIPMQFALYPNAPNPFNPVTVIRYDVPKVCKVSITVYDIRGRKVVTLVRNDELMQPGFYKTSWAGKDDYNRPVATGMYIYLMKADSFVKLRKMIMLK